MKFQVERHNHQHEITGIPLLKIFWDQSLCTFVYKINYTACDLHKIKKLEAQEKKKKRASKTEFGDLETWRLGWHRQPAHRVTIRSCGVDTILVQIIQIWIQRS